MSAPFWQVDAFTDKPFAGNPAGVCLLDQPAEAAWMQAVAAEMNLSETAFLVPGPDGYDLRWFTPRVEVDLCGHATLAAAHVLWSEGILPRTAQARFHTKSGLLRADLLAGGWLELDFPSEPPQPAPEPPGLDKALGGGKRLYVGRNRLDYLVEVEGEEALRGLRPDWPALAAIPARGIIVTCRAATFGLDFLSRFFAPRVGIAEDPVTGSAHCCLGPYWGQRLGKDSLRAFQASARGGHLRVRLAGERVYMAGQAVTVIKGKLL